MFHSFLFLSLISFGPFFDPFFFPVLSLPFSPFFHFHLTTILPSIHKLIFCFKLHINTIEIYSKFRHLQEIVPLCKNTLDGIVATIKDKNEYSLSFTSVCVREGERGEGRGGEGKERRKNGADREARGVVISFDN